MRIILKGEYIDYDNALDLCSLQNLGDRRNQLCYNFAKKCTKNPQTSDMFPLNLKSHNIRDSEKFFVTPADTDRLAKSAIPQSNIKNNW